MDPVEIAHNNIVLLKDQVRQLQDLTDRQAQIIHELKHNHRAILEGVRARVEHCRGKHEHLGLLQNELLSAIDKELING
jgi:hypothetical protein